MLFKLINIVIGLLLYTRLAFGEVSTNFRQKISVNENNESTVVVTDSQYRTTLKNRAGEFDPDIRKTPHIAIDILSGYSEYFDLQTPYVPELDRRADGKEAPNDANMHKGLPLKIYGSYTFFPASSFSKKITLSPHADILFLSHIQGSPKLRTQSFNSYALGMGANFNQEISPFWGQLVLSIDPELRRSNFTNSSLSHYLNTYGLNFGIAQEFPVSYFLSRLSLKALLISKSDVGFSNQQKNGGLEGASANVSSLDFSSYFRLDKDVSFIASYIQENYNFQFNNDLGYTGFGLVVSETEKTQRSINFTHQYLLFGFRKYF